MFQLALTQASTIQPFTLMTSISLPVQLPPDILFMLETTFNLKELTPMHNGTSLETHAMVSSIKLSNLQLTEPIEIE
jgi:hypothetical protein